MTLEQFGFKRTLVDDGDNAEKSSKIRKIVGNSENIDKDLHIPESWKRELSDEFGKEYFKRLQNSLADARKKSVVYPPVDEVFKFMNCKINDIKVVIIGQDPYHGQNQACGLAFSVSKVVKIPPSLRNIYDELKNDIADFEMPSHGDLSGWVSEGVFLLNASLTVTKSSPNSHKDFGWYKFTDAIIKRISQHCENVVFMLWGSFAQQKASIINSKKHLILKAAHPSPFSAHKGFFGCKHFSKANSYLSENKKNPVNWSLK
eukprot:NODE_36_length_31474_cov_0.342438.p15 type:complete len:260 gc:universal NODE_36_length_31474_cov_0.342438:604-1383(+)